MAEMTMIERVARKLFERVAGMDWEAVPQGLRDAVNADMRAMIAEMRVPTEAMIRAGRDCGDWTGRDIDYADELKVWNAMIDAALAEVPTREPPAPHESPRV